MVNQLPGHVHLVQGQVFQNNGSPILHWKGPYHRHGQVKDQSHLTIQVGDCLLQGLAMKEIVKGRLIIIYLKRDILLILATTDKLDHLLQ